MEAIAVELDDDVFFADLSKQISLLIMDDDEDLVAHSPSVSLQGFSQSIQFPASQQALFPFGYDQQTCRREISKGTGVFIPMISQPRRKNNSSRQAGKNSNNNNTSYNMASSNSKLQKNQENSRGLQQFLPHKPSFNPTKY